MVRKRDFSFFIAVSVLVGTCIGAGVLGIPYVAAHSGFIVALGYIVVIGLIILFVNLYLGEIALRTRGDHQLVGYAEKYLGKKGRRFMEFAMIFGIYSAMIAYMLGVGQSLSFLFFKNTAHYIIFGVAFGILMAVLIRRGLSSLKKFEKYGVLIIFGLFLVIIGIFAGKIDYSNLVGFNVSNILLPFGVILFALMSFMALPQVKLVLKRKEKKFKKVLITSSIISVVFYTLFAFVVVGFKGMQTPEVATLALGPVFIFLGIFTIFTSYLAGGNALIEEFMFDERYKKNWAWVFAAVVPIILFVLTQLTSFFSFTVILSIGGVVSGGIIAVLVLLMVGRAKDRGDRKPEYSIRYNVLVILVLIAIFILGMVREIVMAFR